jgi:adenosylhomocysteinase
VREAAIANADVLVTVTGAPNVIGAADLPLLKDGAILINGGHFPHEIDVASMMSDPAVVGTTNYPSEGIETLDLADGRSVHLLGHGHMANLAGPRPLGNSVESMDLGFTLQARCLERVTRGIDEGHCVVPVPADIDAAVANAYLALHR